MSDNPCGVFAMSPSGPFEAGADTTITITYGDTKEHPYGVRVQPWPETRERPFLCLVDTEGDGELRQAAGSPIFPVVTSGPPERIPAVVPSVAAPGETFAVRASVMDRNLTPPTPGYEGPLTFASRDELLSLPDGPPSREGETGVLTGVKA